VEDGRCGSLSTKTPKCPVDLSACVRHFEIESMKLIYPRPNRSVAWNQGHRRPSWFDIARLPPESNEFDEPGLSESVALIENLILSQVHAGIDSRRIILAGFSQGAALSMTVALTTLYFLGGVVSLSGWIPPPARHVSVHIL
jgi:predicted esterase